MNAKKVVNFLVLRSAFTQRNMTSLMLVGLFFVVYLLSGGKVSTQLPNIKRSATTFGGVEMAGVDPALDTTGAGEELGGVGLDTEAGSGEVAVEDSKLMLGVTPSADRAARENVPAKRGRLFDPETQEEDKEEANEPIDKDGLITGGDLTNYREQNKLRRAERKKDDSLSAIEERLRIKRAADRAEIMRENANR